MKNKIGLLLIIPAMLLAGCTTAKKSNSSASSSSAAPSSSSSEEPVDEYVHVNVDMTPNLVEKSEPYHLDFKYKDDFFSGSAKTYDKELSMLTFGAVLSTQTSQMADAFYSELEFKDRFIIHFDETPTKDSIAYAMAHKTIDNYELFAVNIRGFDYGMEWANNFMIGESGDHLGFTARGMEIYLALKTFVDTYSQGRNAKIWVTGYSRGGAVANVLSSLLLTRDDINVQQDNLFVYTFEAPNCLSEEHAVAYENVHNIINTNDLITNIPPTSYGLHRCGVDYEIYDANISTLIKGLDEDIVVPEFVNIEASEMITNDQELNSYILKCLFDSSAEEQYLANTREQYVEHYQAGFSYMIGLIFALKPETRSQLLADLSNLGMGAISLLADETGEELANFFKPYLDQDEIEYQYGVLVGHCATFRNAAVYLLLQPLLFYVTETYRPDMVRLLDMHYVESVYVLLQNAHEK